MKKAGYPVNSQLKAFPFVFSFELDAGTGKRHELHDGGSDGNPNQADITSVKHYLLPNGLFCKEKVNYVHSYL